MNAQEDQRKIRKSRSFNTSLQLLNESNSSSCSDASASDKSSEKTLLRTKYGLRPSRRRFGPNLKHSATFAHSPLSYFQDPGDASSEVKKIFQITSQLIDPDLIITIDFKGGSSPILLHRKTVKQQLNAKIEQPIYAEITELRNARRDQLRKAKERRKREIEILSQANLKKISDSQADLDFLAFANPNAHIPDNPSTVNFTVESTLKTDFSVSHTSSATSFSQTTSDERTQRRMRRQEVYSAPEAGTLQHPNKHTSSANINGAFELLPTTQQLDSSPIFNNIPLPCNQNKIYKSQHSVEDCKSSSSINDNFEMLMRHNGNIEHNRRLETSNTSSDAVSDDDSSEISSEETTVIEACRHRLCSISENSYIPTDEDK